MTLTEILSDQLFRINDLIRLYYDITILLIKYCYKWNNNNINWQIHKENDAKI